MTLLMIDGFDDGQMARKWTATIPGNGVTTGAGGRNGNGLLLTNNGASGGGGVQRNLTPTEAHATLIVGMACKVSSVLNNQTGGIQFLADTWTSTQVWIRVATNGTVQAYRGTTLLGTSASALPWNTWGYLEVKVHFDPAAGTIDVHWNGVSILSLSAQNTRNSGTATVLDAVQITAWGDTTNGNALTHYYDDLYIANGAGTVNNDFLGDCVIDTVRPNGNGFHSDFVGSDSDSVNNYALVNETTPDTTTWVQSSTVGAKDSYTVPVQTHTGTVAGVQVGLYAEKTDVGTRTIAALMRIAGTDYTATAQGALSYNNYTDGLTVIETNPATSAAWTSSDINGAEWGVTVAA